MVTQFSREAHRPRRGNGEWYLPCQANNPTHKKALHAPGRRNPRTCAHVDSPVHSTRWPHPRCRVTRSHVASTGLLTDHLLARHQGLGVGRLVAVPPIPQGEQERGAVPTPPPVHAGGVLHLARIHIVAQREDEGRACMGMREWGWTGGWGQGERSLFSAGAACNAPPSSRGGRGENREPARSAARPPRCQGRVALSPTLLIPCIAGARGGP